MLIMFPLDLSLYIVKPIAKLKIKNTSLLYSLYEI